MPTIGNANINDKVGPTTQDYGGVNHIPRTPIETNSHYYPFWENGESYEIIQNVVPSLPGIYEEPDEKSYNLGHGYLWLGELYREVNPETLFGGTSTAALETNKWQIAGPSTKLVRDKDCIIKYLEGDTYYQRYDHLKTYPSSIENPNSIVEIISFMCETNINIDGRYDNNRGLKSNLTINPQNFNKLNTAYSQSNNFFTYNLLSEDFKNTKFPNSVVWSLSIILGERIDSWTSFNLSSNLDIPPSLGIIRSIEYFKNNLIVFQDTTLSIINYNEKYTITTTQGVPVEIANSGKVDGYTIIDEYSGTKNKWNIVKTPEGIIFIDTLDKKIKRYNGENIEPLTTSKGFSVWANKNIYNAEEWYPTVLKEQSPNYTVYYDSNTEDVYFLYKFYDYSGGLGLAYNNDIQKFSSFYPYYKFNYILNIANKSLGILTNEEGYSYIYELYKSRISNEYFLNDYYITFFLQDQQYFTDKIFTNIEFRASSIDDKNNLNNFNNFLPFNLISIETETSKYQTGEEILKYDRFQISNLKKKFNIWRANIPRDSRSNYGLDRIRNPWA